jgi:hypothetical protein
MQAPPGALAKALVVMKVVAVASSSKPMMIFLANIFTISVDQLFRVHTPMICGLEM